MQTRLNMARKGRRAFTLIELLVVVLILGILMAIAIPLYLSSVKTSSERAVRANLRQIAVAGQAWYVRQEPNAYPTYANIVGVGKDIEAVNGPKGVTYSVATNGSGQFEVTATETATDDAFKTSAFSETMTYNLTTGAFN